MTLGAGVQAVSGLQRLEQDAALGVAGVLDESNSMPASTRHAPYAKSGRYRLVGEGREEEIGAETFEILDLMRGAQAHRREGV